MIDPEIDYRRIVSGDASVLAAAANTLADVGQDLDDARGRIHDAPRCAYARGRTVPGLV